MMNWKGLEQALFDAARQVLQTLLDEGGSPLYGAAFHASYREEGEVLSLPSFAANIRRFPLAWRAATGAELHTC
jgi:hypothetical protein